jgi:hypothetical protein
VLKLLKKVLAIPELIYAVFGKKEYFLKADKLKESKITYPSIIKGTSKPRNQAAHRKHPNFVTHPSGYKPRRGCARRDQHYP